ncbi:dienelactone hydrolase family protein [Longimicrobium sp.]|uniref:dienelactone hydrolase family protein n=1 Tax=Longimicrobium sp. TaxID=2029185 RepID=UPI002B829B20|nr:dienelactone hydrolase family protein [Longimicrobium sp.]HSU17690.1 dienelactone hydrolase family protein [Longimicrobium sp.]
MRRIAPVLALPISVLLAACTPRMGGSADTASAARSQTAIPAGAAEVQARLAASPRHGEWAMVSAGPGDSVRAWVVYPERRDRAPVVVVVHEIFGLTGWIRGVADQLAADGFIAIAPDLLSGKGVPVGPDGDPVRDSATAAIRTLDAATVQRRLDATARYAMALPAALPRYGIVGFCWGGGVSFAHAVHAPGLGASVVYYGVSPSTQSLASVRAPVLGLYGENDARVDATIAPADSAMRALGRTYQHQVFPGAGHGFLRQQDGQNGANLQAARAAWPRTVQWFHRHLRG